MKVDVNASRSIGTSSNELQLGRPQTPVREDLRVSRTVCAVSPKSRSDCDGHPWRPPFVTQIVQRSVSYPRSDLAHQKSAHAHDRIANLLELSNLRKTTNHDQ